ncbi:hypothetical protein GCM10010266_58970 [Streptomyces griseomycini]|nr:hypothetical protein GCM10010266_58970 [Streptomyces griseomycini]GGR35557.1 hypothetical protein GCM10015536_46570 [Streptomyces griseomycini]
MAGLSKGSPVIRSPQEREVTMGSGATFVVVPLLFYCAVMALFCRRVARSSTPRMGWVMAGGLIGLPLCLFSGVLIAAAL